MSQYDVGSSTVNYNICKAGAKLAWDHTPYPSMFFTWEEYFNQCLEDVGGMECLLCTSDDVLVGVMVVGSLVKDSSFPGKGVVVYSMVTHPEHRKAIAPMYRTLVKCLRAAGADWFHTTSRLSATEYRSKFRRVYG